MNWDDARYFLAVARDGRMLGASRKLGVSQARLSRHIAALERALGTSLFDRTTRGCSLTEDGQVLFKTAERVEAEMFNGIAQLRGQNSHVSGTVRIGMPDGFGSAFLVPRLGHVREAYPDLHIQIVPITQGFSLSEREADIAVMVGRPTKGRLRVKRLTDYTLGLYGTQAYFERMGQPRDLQDLPDHILIGYIDDLIYTPELAYAGEFNRNWRSAIEISTAVGQLEAVRSGTGIGILHDFMAAPHPELIRLFPDTNIQRTYWLVWHENMRVARRVQVVADMIATLVHKDRSLFQGGPLEV